MTRDERQLRQLGTLVDLRERERARLEATLADQRAVEQRYRRNLERLQQLARSAGATAASTLSPAPSPALSPSLLLNAGHYREAVLDLAERHRADLAQHEAQRVQTQQALVGATLRHRALDQVRDRQQQRVGQARAQQAQKQQDELAAQVWWRGQAAAG